LLDDRSIDGRETVLETLFDDDDPEVAALARVVSPSVADRLASARSEAVTPWTRARLVEGLDEVSDDVLSALADGPPQVRAAVWGQLGKRDPAGVLARVLGDLASATNVELRVVDPLLAEHGDPEQWLTRLAYTDVAPHPHLVTAVREGAGRAAVPLLRRHLERVTRQDIDAAIARILQRVGTADGGLTMADDAEAGRLAEASRAAGAMSVRERG
jgi:hypothetical protein